MDVAATLFVVLANNDKLGGVIGRKFVGGAGNTFLQTLACRDHDHAVNFVITSPTNSSCKMDDSI